MRPKLAQCTNGNCGISVSMFTSDSASMTCPSCKKSMDLNEPDTCKECKCRVIKGTSICKSCSVSKVAPPSSSE